MGVAHAAVGVRKGLTDGTAGATALPNAPSVAAYPTGGTQLRGLGRPLRVHRAIMAIAGRPRCARARGPHPPVLARTSYRGPSSNGAESNDVAADLRELLEKHHRGTAAPEPIDAGQAHIRWIFRNCCWDPEHRHQRAHRPRGAFIGGRGPARAIIPGSRGPAAVSVLRHGKRSAPGRRRHRSPAGRLPTIKRLRVSKTYFTSTAPASLAPPGRLAGLERNAGFGKDVAGTR